MLHPCLPFPACSCSPLKLLSRIQAGLVYSAHGLNAERRVVWGLMQTSMWHFKSHLLLSELVSSFMWEGACARTALENPEKTIERKTDDMHKSLFSPLNANILQLSALSLAKLLPWGLFSKWLLKSEEKADFLDMSFHGKSQNTQMLPQSFRTVPAFPFLSLQKDVGAEALHIPADIAASFSWHWRQLWESPISEKQSGLGRDTTSATMIFPECQQRQQVTSLFFLF